MHTHTHTNRHRHAHTHTNRHRHTDTHTHTHTHTHTQRSNSSVLSRSHKRNMLPADRRKIHTTAQSPNQWEKDTFLTAPSCHVINETVNSIFVPAKQTLSILQWKPIPHWLQPKKCSSNAQCSALRIVTETCKDLVLVAIDSASEWQCTTPETFQNLPAAETNEWNWWSQHELFASTWDVSPRWLIYTNLICWKRAHNRKTPTAPRL